MCLAVLLASLSAMRGRCFSKQPDLRNTPRSALSSPKGSKGSPGLGNSWEHKAVQGHSFSSSTLGLCTALARVSLVPHSGSGGSTTVQHGPCTRLACCNPFTHPAQFLWPTDALGAYGAHVELFSARLPGSVCLCPQVAGAGDPTEKRPAKGYYAFTQIYCLVL